MRPAQGSRYAIGTVVTDFATAGDGISRLLEFLGRVKFRAKIAILVTAYGACTFAGFLHLNQVFAESVHLGRNGHLPLCGHADRHFIKRIMI
jgi:hypothetical protein